MQHEIFREKFLETFGQNQNEQFVLNLYEVFPLRDKLFFWQEQILNDFCDKFNLEQITYEETYSIFNRCPLHGTELKREIVPIVDGNKNTDLVFNQTSSFSFPLSNVNAPRDFERFSYPEEVEVYYCQDCRTKRLDYLAELKVKNNR